MDDGRYLIGQVQQAAHESLAPGETADRIVDFLPEAMPLLQVGMEWQLCDGPTRVIGRATVLEILAG